MIEEEQTEYHLRIGKVSFWEWSSVNVLGLWFNEPKITVYNSSTLAADNWPRRIELGAALHVGRSAGLRP